MGNQKITLAGAGSGFVLSIAGELIKDPFFDGWEFMLCDPDQERLNKAYQAVKQLFDRCGSHIILQASTSTAAAIEGSDELVLQALCLDPHVHSINQAKNIWRKFRNLYREDLPAFQY